IITGIIPVNMLLEEAKKYSASLTQFLLALYFDTIQEFIRLHPCKLLPVVINLPVNLRNIFPSKTMRNFFISLTPQIDFRLGSYSFEEIINYIRNYMAIALNKKHISQHIHLNVKREKTIFIRLIPLFLKNLM